MSPTRAPAAPRFAALALELIKTISPELRVLDTLFPLSPFLLCGDDTELCQFPENVPVEAVPFYARFRQGGGTRGILPFAEALPGALAAAAAAGQRLLLALHAGNGKAAAETLTLTPARPPILLLAPEGIADLRTALNMLGYTGSCFIRFLHGELDEAYGFFSAEHDSDGLLRGLEAAGKKFAEDMRLQAQRPEGQADTILIFLPQAYQGWSKASLSPLQFVHDSNRTPEGNASYSWLWLANQPQLRILFGTVTGRFRNVRVIVPDALSTHNLKSARFLLNGEAVHPHVEIWSDGQGAVSAELPAATLDPLVFGIWVSEGRTTEDGVTKLYACIDRVELSA